MKGKGVSSKMNKGRGVKDGMKMLNSPLESAQEKNSLLTTQVYDTYYQKVQIYYTKVQR